jgi:cysteine desulfurase
VSRRIYLDHAATTPMLPEAVAAMADVLANNYGNPSGVHREARAARTLLEDARDRIAAVLGAGPHEIVFTGGGTEAINLALTATSPKTLAWSSVEHDAVRSTAVAFERDGVACSELGVNAYGVVDIDAASNVVADVDVVAVMAVNNEVGTVQPINELAGLCASSGALLVVDAVQALPWIDLRPVSSVSNFLTISGHKFGGPKGVGALVVRGGRKIRPLIYGGGQEQERRSGTQNVAGIVAMAVAAEITDRDRVDRIARVALLRDRFLNELCATIADCVETVPRAYKVAGNAHVCVRGVESEELLVMIDHQGIAASAGSACASGALHLSPVLTAMKVPVDLARGSLRFTLGTTTTEVDVTEAVSIIAESVTRLRGPSGTVGGAS